MSEITNKADQRIEIVNKVRSVANVMCKDKSSITHNELVYNAAKWLRRHKENTYIPNCSFILQELSAITETGENPDIIGFCSYRSVMIEVKVSRSDFLADKKKMFRSYDDFGMGQQKFYCCPEGMVKPEEIPDSWGLLYWNGKKIIISKIAPLTESNLRAERTVLLSVIRRVKENNFDLSFT